MGTALRCLVGLGLLAPVVSCGSGEPSERPIDASAAAYEAEARVQSFLDAIEAWDFSALTMAVTDDFQLIEDTVVVDLPTFVGNLEAVRTQGVAIEYRVSDFRTEVDGNVAWTSYSVSARLDTGTGEDAVTWLESAVLQRVDGDWKIDRMQSGQLQSR